MSPPRIWLDQQKLSHFNALWNIDAFFIQCSFKHDYSYLQPCPNPLIYSLSLECLNKTFKKILPVVLLTELVVSARLCWSTLTSIVLCSMTRPQCSFPTRHLLSLKNSCCQSTKHLATWEFPVQNFGVQMSVCKHICWDA